LHPIAITVVLWIAFMSIAFCIPGLNPVNFQMLNTRTLLSYIHSRVLSHNISVRSLVRGVYQAESRKQVRATRSRPCVSCVGVDEM
jgi:hypothetical protein